MTAQRLHRAFAQAQRVAQAILVLRDPITIPEWVLLRADEPIR